MLAMNLSAYFQHHRTNRLIWPSFYFTSFLITNARAVGHN